MVEVERFIMVRPMLSTVMVAEPTRPALMRLRGRCRKRKSKKFYCLCRMFEF